MKATPRQTPPTLAGQIAQSYTILCRSCSVSRTIMSGRSAVERERATLAWQRLGWRRDEHCGWECPQCAGSRPRLVAVAPLAAWRPGMTLGEATPVMVGPGDLCGAEDCPRAGEVEVWLAAAVPGLRVLACVCVAHAVELSAKETL